MQAFLEMACHPVGSLTAMQAVCRQKVYAVPQNAEQVSQQALAASLRAHADGKLRQRLELLLPLIGATDLDDW